MAVHPEASDGQILVVGDVHGRWGAPDRVFVEKAQPDLCLFVGDLGDEDVRVVAEIASVQADIAVVLGNHDAWSSFSKKRCTNDLRRILERLARKHIGYQRRELPSLGLSLIGARPFSWGGPSLRSPELYDELFGIRTMEESADRIVALAEDAATDRLVLVAHNGPLGLSQTPTDIWGKDFADATGDWGDRDLALAIARIVRSGKKVVCVIAGHMHDRVQRTVSRRRRFVERDGIIYVNPAVVPRRRQRGDGAEVGHFVRLRFTAGSLDRVEELWVGGGGVEVGSREPNIPSLRGVQDGALGGDIA